MEDDAAVEYFFYEMGDMKFLYMVTKHCQWNVTHHPFLCCTCRSGEGVKKNRDHTCEFLSHEDEIELHDLSEKQWIEGKKKYVLDKKNYKNYRRLPPKEKKRKRTEKTAPQKPKKFTRKTHMEWCDEFNSGISHFGIHPKTFPQDQIRFDVFHMMKQLTLKLLKVFQWWLFTYCSKIFRQYLRELFEYHWDKYPARLFFEGGSLDVLTGTSLQKFVEMIEHSTLLGDIGKQKGETPLAKDSRDMIALLKLFPKINTFTKRTEIKEEEEGNYQSEIDRFTENVELFYEYGKSILFNNGNNPGDETSYAHVLRFYMPMIAQETWDKHGAPLGIYNMQGYKQRNLESKTIYKRFTNKKGNIVAQILPRLIDIFMFEFNKKKTRLKKKIEKERRDFVKTEKQKQRPPNSYEEYVNNRQSNILSDDDNFFNEMATIKFEKKEVKDIQIEEI